MSEADSIAQTILQGANAQAGFVTRLGDLAAQGKINSAQIWGQALNNIGSSVAAIPQQMQQQKVDALKLQDVQAQIAERTLKSKQDARTQAYSDQLDQLTNSLTTTADDGTVTIDRPKLQQAMTARGIPLEMQQKQLGILDNMDKSMQSFTSQHTEALADLANGAITAMGHGASQTDALNMAAVLGRANRVITKDDLGQVQALTDAAANGQDIRPMLMQIQALSPKYKSETVIIPKDATLFDKATHTTLATGVAGAPTKDELAAKSVDPTLTPEQRAAAKAALDAINAPTAAQQATEEETNRHNVTMEGISDYRAHHPATSGTQATDAQNAKDIAEAIMNGEQPPVLTGLYRNTAAVKAELSRNKYDQSSALLDWEATKKHLITLNGSQQTRLQQAINQLPELLDTIDTLAKQWHGGRFPLLNKANLAAAKAGAYGNEVATVANQLDAQISDVTADLGTVYMGGNSPTDKALGLSQKQLSGEWDQTVLENMVKNARNNVRIRQNSIKNTGVQGVSGDNIYADKIGAGGATAPSGAAPSTPQSGRISVVGPNGEKGTVPAASASSLPPGWKVAQ